MNTEQATDDNGQLQWRKSSYSGTGGGDCVEVATAQSGIHVRDSKNKRGPELAVTSEPWGAFLAYAVARRLP
ncbi:DUF397 domain-containing protein [Streptomyces sp. NPDC002795]|uniref:DUF397 domain-containing protein n=1 Tax=Streptomyces sp. NPDC002795 TaxID=3364665 RepID=UPI00367FEDB6